MSYPALPDRAIPYHNDGTVVKIVLQESGVLHDFTTAEMEELNDYDYNTVVDVGCQDIDRTFLVFHFPEKRTLTGIYAMGLSCSGSKNAVTRVEGSNDTTNGVDGTWTEIPPATGASFPPNDWNFDSWRASITALNPADDYKSIRILFSHSGGDARFRYVVIAHLYGHKASGETPDDLLWVDPSTGAELSLPLDFGPVPAGSSDILQTALKNASTSLTAQNITINVSDPDDIIRIGWSSNGPWELSLSITDLAPGAQSATIFVKAEPPAPPTPLKPHRAPILASVGAWV